LTCALEASPDMLFVHIPRVLWSVGRGSLRSPVAVGLPGRPHVYRARVNALLDIDQFGHMNNAAYAVHFEMARWEMGAASGLVTHTLRHKIAFIVASVALRFRRELKPLQAFEIHSECVCADDKGMHLLQLCREPGGGRVMAGSMSRAVLRKGRELVSPRQTYAAVVGGENLPPSGGGSEIEALARLEQALA